MEKFITTPAFSPMGNKPFQTAQFKQLFASLTGYDIMFEESRKDLMLSNASGISQKAVSQLLPNYINKIIVLFERK